MVHDWRELGCFTKTRANSTYAASHVKIKGWSRPQFASLCRRLCLLVQFSVPNSDWSNPTPRCKRITIIFGFMLLLFCLMTREMGPWPFAKARSSAPFRWSAYVGPRILKREVETHSIFRLKTKLLSRIFAYAEEVALSCIVGLSSSSVNCPMTVFTATVTAFFITLTYWMQNGRIILAAPALRSRICLSYLTVAS